ncbi:hypothetical protein MUN82_14030 [Hymenobacter aerilatus]|uniref:Uncharacterized protein n=1 Tax=Hymenobacter aerilatus TaxID=2932251 RepID=A0A8T9SV15_9BACT|nr:hypothetical protein [Hymenobacter aerilatus]UOR04060.1 hypothetical protein MUN82_14030 [Hymenobacter aerilatus]
MLLPRTTYYVILCALLLLFATTLWHRISHFDDAWSTELSYQLLKDGFVRSSLFGNYQQWDEHLYMYHKAFVYVQAGILYFIGFDIWAARATTLLFTGSCLLLLLVYFRPRKEQQLLAALLYVGCGSLWLFGVDSRPETMVATFGFASFLLLQKGILSPRRLLLAGALAGFAALTHLNGLIYIGAGTFWLLPRSGWRGVILFSAAGSLVAGLFLADALIDDQLPLLLYQFTHYPVNQNNHDVLLKLHTMARYDRIFFHSEGEAPLTVLLIMVILITSWGRPIQKMFTPAARYLVWLLVVFWLLTKSHNAYYYILFVPFFIVIITEAVSTVELPKLRRYAIAALIALYPLGSATRAYNLLRENYTYPPVATENARLASRMPQKNTKIIAPMSFFFGQMDNYHIKSLTYYSFIDQDYYNKQLTTKQFFDLAARDTVRYIISDFRKSNKINYIKPDTPTRVGPYRRVYKDQWHSVYAWQPREAREQAYRTRTTPAPEYE